MLYSDTRVKMNYDTFSLMIYVLQIVYDSYLLHVYFLPPELMQAWVTLSFIKSTIMATN